MDKKDFTQLDAYQFLLEQLNIDHHRFLEIGIGNILQIDEETVMKQWKMQKDAILAGGASLGIRNYGRYGKFNEHFKVLYNALFDCTISFDKTNNAYPAKMMDSQTTYRKNRKAKSSSHTVIFNYQLAHIFGCTKNPLLFTALWNLAYIPKYLDPFTGHETKGELSDSIREVFQEKMRRKLSVYLEDYNNFYHTHIANKLEPAFETVRDQLGSSAMP